MMPKKNEFPKPLNTWVTEEMPVEKIDFDPETKTASKGIKMEKLRVKYMDVPKKKYRCKGGEHVFRSLDKGRYIFGCTKCQFARQVYPGIYKLTSKGYLIHIASGRRV